MVDFFHFHHLHPLCRKMMRPTFYHSPFRQKILLFCFSLYAPRSSFGSVRFASGIFPCPPRRLPVQ
ncbi:hypothetical protein EPB69_11515 [Geobacillus stearothermophilus]|nr:hypothetical protein EPB69_11515 [Geobacillus stearothermophilus]